MSRGKAEFKKMGEVVVDVKENYSPDKNIDVKLKPNQDVNPCAEKSKLSEMDPIRSINKGITWGMVTKAVMPKRVGMSSAMSNPTNTTLKATQPVGGKRRGITQPTVRLNADLAHPTSSLGGKVETKGIKELDTSIECKGISNEALRHIAKVGGSVIVGSGYGAGAGAIAGAGSAKKGERWKGAKRGAKAGAAFGALAGGARGTVPNINTGLARNTKRVLSANLVATPLVIGYEKGKMKDEENVSQKGVSFLSPGLSKKVYGKKGLITRSIDEAKTPNKK